MTRKLFALLLGFLFSILAPTGVFSATGTEYAISSTVSIDEDYSASVRTIIEIDATDGSVPANISIPAFGSNIRGLEATFADSQQLSAEVKENYIQLFTAPAQTAGSKKISIKISYTANVGVAFGKSYIISIPPRSFGELNVVSEALSISTDTTLGLPVSRGQKPTESSPGIVGDAVNKWIDTDSAFEQSIGLLFGDTALANVTLEKTLTNDSLWWKTESIVLPPDTNQQRVFINSVTPEPTRVSLDEDGNVILDYRLSPRQKIDVLAKTSVALNSYVYSLESKLGVNDVDPVLSARYTTLGGSWNDTAIEIAGAESLSAVELVSQIYKKVSTDFATVEATTALEASTARSNFLVGELRANKVPSRLVVGAAFGNGHELSQTPLSHAWVEAYIPSVGWITLDSSFEQNGDYFGVTDVQRIALVMRGFDSEHPPENLSDFKISYLDKEVPAIPLMKPEIIATKYVIFPGLSFDVVNVKMPKGVIVDGAGLVVGSEELSHLGSLAPFQTASVRSFGFLADSFTAESVQYGVFAADAVEDGDIIVQTTMAVSYIPFIGLIVLIAILWILIKIIFPGLSKFRTESSKKRAEKKEAKKKDSYIIATDKAGEKIEHIDMLSDLNDAVIDKDESKTAPPMAQPAVVNPPKKNTVKPGATSREQRPLKVGDAQSASPVRIEREVRKRRRPLIQ